MSDFQFKRARFRELAENHGNISTGRQFVARQQREKLLGKIEQLKRRLGMMKRANELICEEDREGLADLGFSDNAIAKLLNTDLAGRRGFPVSALKSNSANIRRLQKRLADLQKAQSDETIEDSGLLP
jgi:hypothetical protein